MLTLSREQVLAFRVRQQQLGRASGTAADTAVLDLGVQDTGADGAGWALALRGLTAPDPVELATVWTIRGAPHVYRRTDLPGIAAATAPFSDADAAKRIFDAARPLKAAGVPILTALDTVAARMREIVTGPMVKGEMSTRLTAVLEEPYLRFCASCDAVHTYEQPFRLAALRAGLELQPDTSPPVLQPVPGLEAAAEVPERLDVIRAHLRLLGPTTPKLVAGYLDAPVRDVTAHWPEDSVEVSVDGERRWALDVDAMGDTLDGDPPTATLLLGAYDLFLQARDRSLLAPDPARAKTLWPVLGRPGAVLVGAEIAGTWRARKAGTGVAVTVDAWEPLSVAQRAAIGEQAERLAAFRELSLSTLEVGE